MISPAPRVLLHIVALALLSITMPAAAQTTQPSGGIRLLFNGKDLSGWHTFLRGVGRDTDSSRIFQVHEGAIHIYKDAPNATTQPFGYLCSDEEIGDCRIRLEYKWGEKRFGTRATKKRDSGFLYFVFDENKLQSSVWPHSVECQIQENDVGDIFAIGTIVSTTIDPKTASEKAPMFLAADARGSEYTTPGKMNDRIIRNPMMEKPGWNSLEVVLEGDGATHIVNGTINMKIMKTTRPDPADPARNLPLRRGRIVLQAEGAEVMYRNIEVHPL
jgi:hypothetical protein